MTAYYPTAVADRFRAEWLRLPRGCAVWGGPSEGFRLNEEHVDPKLFALELRGLDPCRTIRRLCSTPGCLVHVLVRRAEPARSPTHKGGRVGRLSEPQVHELRRLFWIGRVGSRKLGEQYGISASAVWLVAVGRTYGYVPFERDVLEAAEGMRWRVRRRKAA